MFGLHLSCKFLETWFSGLCINLDVSQPLLWQKNNIKAESRIVLITDLQLKDRILKPLTKICTETHNKSISKDQINLNVIHTLTFRSL